jgi:branched-chain amino acid transport system permease protein
MTTAFRKERLDRGIKVRSDDIFALSSWREALYLLLPRILPFLLLFILPLVVGTYWMTVIVIAAVYALLSLSWDFIHSAGMISLGHGLFFGLGAYSSAALNHYFGINPIISIPIGALIGGLISTAMLAGVLRLRGIYFGMVTFALSLMMVRIIEATHIFNGNEGLSGLTPYPDLNLEVYLALILVVACLFGFRRLLGSDYGLVLHGINENDRGVMSAGINIYWFKIQALFIGSTVAAFAGAFLAHHTRSAGPSFFGLEYSIMPVACVVVGGTGTLAGPVLGAFILTPISELMRAFGAWRTVFYSVIMAIFVVVVPEGIFHYLQRQYQQFERKVTVEAKK